MAFLTAQIRKPNDWEKLKWRFIGKLENDKQIYTPFGLKNNTCLE